MKRIIILSVLFAVSYSVFAQLKRAEDVVKVKSRVLDFGKVQQGKLAEVDLPFDNISDSAIVVEDVEATCGCMIASGSEGTVAKNKSNKITAQYLAGGHGPFKGQITVKVKGISAPLVIKFKGESLDEKEFAEFQKSKETADN